MNPAFQAAEVYRSEPSSHTFWEVLDFYLAHGWVHSTPDFFVMGRPVSREWPDEVIVDPIHNEEFELTKRHDCWHIALMAGDLVAARNMLPFPLPFVSFERRNELRFYRHDIFFQSLRRRAIL